MQSRILLPHQKQEGQKINQNTYCLYVKFKDGIIEPGIIQKLGMGIVIPY